MSNQNRREEIIQLAHKNETYLLWLEELRRCFPAYLAVWYTLTPEQQAKIAAYQSALEEITDILLRIAYEAGQQHPG